MRDGPRESAREYRRKAVRERGRPPVGAHDSAVREHQNDEMGRSPTKGRARRGRSVRVKAHTLAWSLA